jgi:hypothetical protein
MIESPSRVHLPGKGKATIRCAKRRPDHTRLRASFSTTVKTDLGSGAAYSQASKSVKSPHFHPPLRAEAHAHSSRRFSVRPAIC